MWGAKSEVAHKWAKWLNDPWHVWGARDQKRPTKRPRVYITAIVWGVPNASEQKTQTGMDQMWA